ncbi:MAG: hypothetical protein HQK49_00690 [Oligoflexia bacterium]|nr:hypothetical protein [Oligoflexia bacterium]
MLKIFIISIISIISIITTLTSTSSFSKELEELFINVPASANNSNNTPPVVSPSQPPPTGYLGGHKIKILWAILTNPLTTQVIFNFSEKHKAVINKKKLEYRSATSFTWYGTVEDKPLEDIVVTIHNGKIYASLKIENHFFVLYTLPSTSSEFEYAIADYEYKQPDLINDAIIPSNLNSDSKSDNNKTNTSNTSNLTSKANDDGTLMDILVVYTTAAASAASSVGGIDLLIQNAVDTTNLILSNSDVNYRVRVVRSQEVIYTDPVDIEIALDQVTDSSDGNIDSVHTLRDEVGADFVSFWVKYLGGPYAGIGYLLTTGSASSRAPAAFTVVAMEAGYDNSVTFAHELGHNWGAHHERANATRQGSYYYSYGYYTGVYGTIMSYQYQGARVKYFSNPAKQYNGATLGVGIENQSTAANNSLTLNNQALQSASYRTTVIDPGNTTTITSTGVAAIELMKKKTMVEGCFIATAAYGTPFDKDLDILRRFRDEILETYSLGRWFTNFYYQNSPPLARWLVHNSWAQKPTRLLLKPVVLFANYLLKNRGKKNK